MNDERDLLNIIESSIELAFINQRKKAYEHLAKSNCSSCRYAKVCNPKRGAKVFRAEYSSTTVRLVCSKRKQRKTPIPFEETRIYKIAYKKEEK